MFFHLRSFVCPVKPKYHIAFSCFISLISSYLWQFFSLFSCFMNSETFHELFSCVQLFVTPYTVARQVAWSSTISQSLLKFMSIESVMLSDYSILCHPLLFLPSIFPSIRVFFSESALCIRWLEYCSFSISPSDEYSGRISFRIDWFDLPAVQGILKSLLQYHSSKGSKVQKCKAQLWLHITIS